MRRFDFNQDWTCHRAGETEKKQVTLPHDAMISEKRTADSAGGTNIGWFEGCDYIYEKEFFVPADYEGLDICFEFEGVYHNAEVYLNGKKAAFWPYGYSNFYVPAISFLRYGEKNKIRVIVRNGDQPNSRWYSGTGIYRPVWMCLSPEKHIERNGIRIRTVSLTPAVVEAEIKTSAAGVIELEVYEAGCTEKGGAAAWAKIKTAGKATVRLTVPDAKLWSPQRPELYTLRVKFRGNSEEEKAVPFDGDESSKMEDSEEISFGIRTIAWDTEKGFSINGERVILRGACLHHDNGVLGACCYAEAEERKIRILKENGYNAVRSAHNPCSKALLEACDKLGMMVMDELADMWYIHKTEYDYANYFSDWWKKDLKEMVAKDYCHPSVILYSIGNEVSETAQKKGIRLTKEMTDYLHGLDDTRPVTCGINSFFNFLSSIGLGVYSDRKARKEAEQAEKSRGKKKRKAVGSQFFNELAGLMGSGFMKTGAAFSGCDVRTRNAFANMDIAGYNYGIKRYCHDLKKYPKRLILGSETFCSDAYRFWEMAKENPRIIGDFVWAGMDYLGEAGLGAWEYKDYAPDFSHGPGWLTSGCGRIDLTGKPLAEAAYTKIAFELTEGPVIAVRPVNHTKEKHSPSAWKMTNAIESWSWNGCEGNRAHVEVYARAASVKLFLNGKQVGKKKLKNCCNTNFMIKYEPGVLEAAAYGPDGRETGRCALRTAEAETVLRAIPEEKRVKRNGLCFIRLQYTDPEGILKPLERGRLRVGVENGRLLGLGSACPYSETGYCGNEADTYYGEALAVVKASGRGSIKVTVLDGTYRDRIEIETEE